MKAKKVICFGEVMLRLSTIDYQKIEQAEVFQQTFGGSEMNVAASLIRYGIDARHVTVFPDNIIGIKALRYIESLGIDSQFIKLHGDRLGLYYLEKGASMRASQIVYDRENSAFANLDPDWFDWEEILKDADWFHWSGITAAISRNTAQACLDAVKAAQRLGLTVSSDIYYRTGQWKFGKSPQEVLPELASYSNLLLANTDNMEKLLGVKVSKGADSFEKTCMNTMEKFGNIKKVVCTHREQFSSHHNKISATLFDGTKTMKSTVIDITYIVDRVGGGDAFIGGLIYGQLTYCDDQKSIEFGTASSALKHTIQGDINRVDIIEVENLMNGDTSGRIKR